jgi:hypothetical protein
LWWPRVSPRGFAVTYNKGALVLPSTELSGRQYLLLLVAGIDGIYWLFGAELSPGIGVSGGNYVGCTFRHHEYWF